MKSKHIIWKILYSIRDFRSKEIFKALNTYCTGDVLDIGGWDFYLTIKNKGLNYKTWTTLENDIERTIKTDDPRFKLVHGDGCNMPFKDNSFDFVLNIQVLEHVFKPNKMVSEIRRVLKPGSYAILLIPQTSILHLAPHHYYNFTRYWILEALGRSNLDVIELKPLGGFWSTIASRLFHFFPQSFRFGGMSTKEYMRSPLFYLLYPLMALYAIINIPICMFLALGDLTEEPNNHFVLARKRLNA